MKFELSFVCTLLIVLLAQTVSAAPPLGAKSGPDPLAAAPLEPQAGCSVSGGGGAQGEGDGSKVSEPTIGEGGGGRERPPAASVALASNEMGLAEARNPQGPTAETQIESSAMAASEKTPVPASEIECPSSEAEPSKEAATTTVSPTSSSPASPRGPPSEPRPVEQKRECEETLCLNGGTCLVMSDGQEKCFCPEAFWGARCQLRNICKAVIADNEIGERICHRLSRACIMDDKLFRCSCGPNEYFVFKPDYYVERRQRLLSVNGVGSEDSASQTTGAHSNKLPGQKRLPQTQATFAYDAALSIVQNQERNGQSTGAASAATTAEASPKSSYLAECRKVDECLGVRCRQLSEVCKAGKCECNARLGYVREREGGLCKLLDPCKQPTEDGRPPCGEAHCLPTFDSELYRCVCKIGYHALISDKNRSSTKCVLLSKFICMVPLLNNCQHICKVNFATSSYTCSCLPGYKAGTRPGFDDHLCFFDEHVIASSKSRSKSDGGGDHDDQDDDDDDDDLDAGYGNSGFGERGARFKRHVVFKLLEQGAATNGSGEPTATNRNGERLVRRSVVLTDQITKQQKRLDEAELEGLAPSGPSDADDLEATTASATEPGDYYEQDANNQQDEIGSAQDSCNRFCDENKICALDDPTAGSYRCVCDRQGFVSVGDKCLDWCAAAEFSHSVRFLLDLTCVTGLCERRANSFRPPASLSSSFYASPAFTHLNESQRDLIVLSRKSSWRPTFKCNCKSSPLVYADSESHLCKLNFKAILEPCLPGNEGHTDCVINKHAYCAVLHEDPLLESQSLTTNQLIEQVLLASAASKGSGSNGAGAEGGPPVAGGANPAPPQVTAPAEQYPQQKRAPGMAGTSGKKTKPRQKGYVCVCSPDKKFLVDKPRNKARCVDECDLLTNECGRFNRMCRAATVNSNEHFGANSFSLVREDPDGVRLNQFKRTGCECLPGFNVGPSEPRDFTLDTNNQDAQNGQHTEGQEGIFNAPATTEGVTTETSSPTKFRRKLAWDNLRDLFQEPGSAVEGADGLSQLEPVSVANEIIQGDLLKGQEIEHSRARYMNINSRCLLDYDVVEFHARFKAPADFEPSWVRLSATSLPMQSHAKPSNAVATESVSAWGKQQQTAAEEEEAPTVFGSNLNNFAGEALKSLRDGAASTHPKTRQSKQAKFPKTPPTSNAYNNIHLSSLERLGPSYLETPITTGANHKLPNQGALLKVPGFVYEDISELYKHIVLVADCEFFMSQKSFEAYEQCVRYKYWTVQKLRAHFADWRRVMTRNLRETFDLMEGNIRFRVNKCEAIIKRITSVPMAYEESIVQEPVSPSQSGKPNDHSTQSESAESRQQQVPGNKNAQSGSNFDEIEMDKFDPWDQFARVDADLDCELTIHSASDHNTLSNLRALSAKKVLLEKQLPKFIFKQLEFLDNLEEATSAAAEKARQVKRNQQARNNSASQAPQESAAASSSSNKLEVSPTGSTQHHYYHHHHNNNKLSYYLMAPNALIHSESFDQLAMHRKAFSPCHSEYSYCDRQTRCEMQDSVNYSCTCEAGYTPIGSRDIYFRDSRKEVCEDINECLFDVCKGNGLEDKSICVNEIGDYRCQCIRHHVGDNKRFCDHICNVIACKHGDCRIPDEHHAFCECYEGYREADCSVQDPSVALRKANMIICSSIFASVLLLAITLAISLNSQLKKTKKKLKTLEAAQEAVEFYEFSLQQPPYRRRVSSKASIGS